MTTQATAEAADPEDPRIRAITSAADPATAYAEAVVAGIVVAGLHVRASCARHLRDLVEGPARGLSWDLEAASPWYGERTWKTGE